MLTTCNRCPIPASVSSSPEAAIGTDAFDGRGGLCWPTAKSTFVERGHTKKNVGHAGYSRLLPGKNWAVSSVGHEPPWRLRPRGGLTGRGCTASSNSIDADASKKWTNGVIFHGAIPIYAAEGVRPSCGRWPVSFSKSARSWFVYWSTCKTGCAIQG